MARGSGPVLRAGVRPSHVGSIGAAAGPVVSAVPGILFCGERRRRFPDWSGSGGPNQPCQRLVVVLECLGPLQHAVGMRPSRHP